MAVRWTDVRARCTVCGVGTVLLNLFGAPSPIVELFLVAVGLYIVASLYFTYAFDAAELDRTLEGTSNDEPSTESADQ